MSKFTEWLRSVNQLGVDSDKLKYINYIATSDSDDSYLKEEWKKSAKKFRWFYIILIFFVVGVSFFGLFLPPDEQTKWTQSFFNVGLNIFIFIVLLLDYLLRWITYPVRAGKYSVSPLLFFPLTGISLIMIISILPTLFAVFAPVIDSENPFVSLINVFSVVKILRLLLLLNVVPTFKIFSSIFARNRVLLINVFIFVGVMALIFALLIYSVEGVTHWIPLAEAEKEGYENLIPNEQGLVKVPINKNITNFGDALYFTFVTITTIGYGDISPVTSIGRAVVILDAIIGVVIFAIPSGIITGSFIVEAQEMYKDHKKTKKEKEMEKLSFAEKFYIKTITKTKALIGASLAIGSKKRRKMRQMNKSTKNEIKSGKIIIFKLHKSSPYYEKILEHLTNEDIKSIDEDKTNLIIEINDIDNINDNLYQLLNLLNIKYEIELD